MRFIIFASWLSSTSLALIIHFNKELHVHPFPLQKLLYILQSAYFYTLMIGPTVCNTKFPVLYQKTLVIFSSSWEGLHGEYKATQWLNVSQTFLISIYWYFNLFVLKLTIMDLIRVIRSPFKKHGTYIQFTPLRRIVVTIGALSIVWTSICQAYYHKTDPDTEMTIEAFANFIYFILLLLDSVISLIYVSWYFKSSNFGIEIK